MKNDLITVPKRVLDAAYESAFLVMDFLGNVIASDPENEATTSDTEKYNTAKRYCDWYKKRFN